MRLEGRRVLVAGIGASGTAAAHALLRAGAEVLAVDAGGGSQVVQRATALDAAGALVKIDTPLDRHGLLDGVGLVVASPGVAQHSPLLTLAERRGVVVWSEPELAWRLSSGASALVGVTGTNGKTTTTELIAACLGAPAAGNIGRPLVELLAPAPGLAPPPLVVVELSSFQLRFSHTLRPDVAVLCNVAPDHLDWHGGLADYEAAKARIWMTQRAADLAVWSDDDAGARRVAHTHPPPGRGWQFTVNPPGPGQVGVEDGWIVERVRDRAGATPVARVDALALTGRHNVANACAAVAACLGVGAAPSSLGAPLRAFRAGAHRLEPVAHLAGVAWVNDSKATNPHAAAAALAAYPPVGDDGPRVVWIGGGLNKGLTFDELAGPLAAGVRVAVTIGASGPQLARLTRRLGIATVEATDLSAAVAAAAHAARPGDVVLLAPACASMDQFRDYAERGEAFRDLVGRLVPAPPVAGGRNVS